MKDRGKNWRGGKTKNKK